MNGQSGICSYTTHFGHSLFLVIFLVPKKKELINSVKFECQNVYTVIKTGMAIQIYLLALNSFKNSGNKVYKNAHTITTVHLYY